jgi:hypothetical protein
MSFVATNSVIHFIGSDPIWYNSPLWDNKRHDIRTYGVSVHY